jgi:hypothetical protein
LDLNDLTWEQREKVLRELFARMNGNKAKSDSNNKNIAALMMMKDPDGYDSNDENNSPNIMDKRDITVKSSSTNKAHNNKDSIFLTQAELNEQNNNNNVYDKLLPQNNSKSPTKDNNSEKSVGKNSLPKLPAILTQ